MKKQIILGITVILALLLLLPGNVSLGEGTDTIRIKDGNSTVELSVKAYGYDKEDRTSYTVTLDGYNVLLSGKLGVITDIMPFNIAIAWSPSEYLTASTFGVTMDPETVGFFRDPSGGAIREPLYIIVAPKGWRISNGYYYVIDKGGFYSAEELFGTPTPAPTEEPEEKFKTAGKYVTFGSYPQTTEGTDHTPIEWLVLDYDENKNRSLLISRYALDHKPYNNEETFTNWEKSDLRKWLNSDFLNAAFNPQEQAAIPVTEVDNRTEQTLRPGEVESEESTQDRVFLLSYQEAEYQFFTDDNSRRCTATDYAIANGAKPSSYMIDGKGTVYWWLRTTAWQYFDNISEVCAGGYTSVDECYRSLSVRPVIWVDVGLLNQPLTGNATPSPAVQPTPTPSAAIAADPIEHPEALKHAGEYVFFGTYPQTAEGKDKTPIEWLVLEHDEAGHCTLLLSRYGLDAQPFHKKPKEVTWKNSTLHSWLNREFMKNAFSKKEQAAILTTEVVTSSSEQGLRIYDNGKGVKTKDKVFLLSNHEATEQYFSTREARQCAATDYAIANGCRVSEVHRVDGRPAVLAWLLRSDSYQFASGIESPAVTCYGYIVLQKVEMPMAIRPAMWVNTDAKIFTQGK